MNFSLPTLTTGYAEFLAQMKERDKDIAIWFDDISSENLPNKTKRWNSSGSKFEIWDGIEWSDLSTLYEIKSRDSDKLNGQTASYYAVANHGHTAATITANGFMSFNDKEKLNSIAENANNYTHPTGDGNLHVPANGIANNGKFLQATSVAGVYSWASIPSSSLSSLGITATAAELNILNGALISTTHLNYLMTLSSNVQTQIENKAPLLSASLAGIPTAPTAAVGTNTTQIATTAFVNANSNKIAPFTAGTYPEVVSLTGATTSSVSYVKVKEVHVVNSGVVTVSFGLLTNGNGIAASGRIYVNGVAVGTIRSTTSTSFTTYTENITIPAQAYVQLYIKTVDATYTANVNGIKILVATPMTSSIVL